LQSSYSYESVEELPAIAKQLLDVAGSSFKIWLFVGEMGSGKTTLIKELCHILGVKDQVQSPTYSIVNEYVGDEGSKPIYHFDLFRLESYDEVLDLGFWEYLDSGGYCFIEWPDLILEHLDLPTVTVNITANDVNCRTLQLSFNEFS
jgi:tRNA threonylcarbamoyladenosine biosynthesis protein TsaE